MATSKRQRKIEQIEEVKVKPQEIQTMESLITSNGWKMIEERIDATIKWCTDEIIKEMPNGMTKEQREIYMDDIERMKGRISVYNELKQLPTQVMLEYGESSFIVDKSGEV